VPGWEGGTARYFRSVMTRPTILKVIVSVLGLAAMVFARTGRASAGGEAFEIKLPVGMSYEVWNYFIPKENPMTREKVELGKDLFFDKRLSADGSVSCSTCHDPKYAFTDGKSVAEGIHGHKGTRSAPSILNAVFNSGQFWDGRVESLEAQAMLPMINPDEMGNSSSDDVTARLASSPDYTRRFQQVFGGPVTADAISKAIAAFERTLVSGNSPFDRYMAGDHSALSESARRGMFLFSGKARCTVCHNFLANFTTTQSFPFFSDQMYHNTGVAAADASYLELSNRAASVARQGAPANVLRALAGDRSAAPLGRFLVTGNSLDIGAFKTPTLRDCELTAPYFHDGSLKTLAEVVKFYVKGGNRNPNRDWELQAVNLTEQEQAELVEFLKSLTSDDTRKMVEEARPGID
jgi:cytochrome c peroxidase